MSSIQSSFAQPKTRALVAVATGAIRTLAEVTTALTGVSGISYSQVGSLYVVDSATHLESFLARFAANPVTKNTLAVGETLVDMGADLTFGVVGVEGKLLKFRAVKRTFSAVTTLPTDALVGYVLVENNSSGAALPGAVVSVVRV